MEPLKREEYSAAYFGDDPAGSHPAGYDPAYGRGVHAPGDEFVALAELIRQQPVGRVLELGAAMGYLVGDLRRRGLDATGVDWSAYAVTARPDPAARLVCADAFDYLQLPEAKADLLISRFFLETFRTTDIPALARLMNRAAPRQMHVLSKRPNEKWYLDRPLNWWAAQGFAPGTLLAVWASGAFIEEVEVR